MNAAVDEYYGLAKGHAMCDYGFHVIVTDPTEEQMREELPRLVQRGITSVKVSSVKQACAQTEAFPER